jgi:hypothetical protein
MIWIFLFSACSKKDQVFGRQGANRDGVYSSAWEEVSNWKSSDSAGWHAYSFTRTTPQLTPDVIGQGVVLAFLRTNGANARDARSFKAVSLPFYFLPTSEKDPVLFYDYDAEKAGTIQVRCRLQAAVEAPQATAPGLQFRYFILTKDFLQNTRWTQPR